MNKEAMKVYGEVSVQPNTFLTLALGGSEGTAVRGKAPVPISQTTGLVQKPVSALGRKEKKKNSFRVRNGTPILRPCNF